MPNILALDTSTNACSVALQSGEHIFSEHCIAPRQHAELILQFVQSLLQQANVKLQDLHAIAFGQGPGSFMGVRIAISVAQSLAYTANVPLIAVSSLQALAQQAFLEHAFSHVVAGWDARMNGIYMGTYRLKSDCMQAELADCLVDVDCFQWPAGAKVAVGHFWQAYPGVLPENIERFSLWPQASAMLAIALQHYKHGQVMDPMQAEPVYLRNQIAIPA